MSDQEDVTNCNDESGNDEAEGDHVKNEVWQKFVGKVGSTRFHRDRGRGGVALIQTHFECVDIGVINDGETEEEDDRQKE